MEKNRDEYVISEVDAVPLRSYMVISPDGGKTFKDIVCHGSYMTHGNLRQYFSFSHLPYSKEEIISWIDFMNDCGFPCSIVFEETEIELVYKDTIKSEFYIAYKSEDYLNSLHWSVGLTAIRMPGFSRIRGLSDVPKEALANYGKAEYADAYFTLLSAFRGKSITFYSGNHSLISEANIKNFIPITRKELEQRCLSGSYTTVNTVSIKTK